MSHRILIVGDTHFPFVHAANLERIYSFAREFKPIITVQIGDLYDCFAWSKFPRKRDVYTPEDEIRLGREMAEDFWRSLQRAYSKTKCYQLRGNHDERPLKKLIAHGPELSFLRPGIDGLFQFKGVTTLAEERDELILGDVVFMHGNKSGFARHVEHTGLNTVCGHSHRGSVVYIRRGDKTLWELNAGFVADTRSLPLCYGSSSSFPKTTQGFGVIDAHGPRFIALPND